MTARRLLPAVLAWLLLALGLAGGASGRTTAGNRLAAERDVAALLARFDASAGVRPLRSIPPKADWWLRSKGLIPPHAADAHHLWRIDASARWVVAFVRAHPPSSSQLHLDNSTPRTAHTLPSHHLVFDFPARPGRIWVRQLYIAVVPLRKDVTALRVDAQDQWVWTQTARDRLPGVVREIDVSRVQWAKHKALSLEVRSVAKIRRIAGWVRKLDVVPPHTGCPADGPPGAMLPPLTISFRGAGGALLARIGILGDGVGPAPACQAMAYSVRGHTRDALVGGSFPARLERLLRLG